MKSDSTVTTQVTSSSSLLLLLHQLTNKLNKLNTLFFCFLLWNMTYEVQLKSVRVKEIFSDILHVSLKRSFSYQQTLSLSPLTLSSLKMPLFLLLLPLLLQLPQKNFLFILFLFMLTPMIISVIMAMLLYGQWYVLQSKFILSWGGRRCKSELQYCTTKTYVFASVLFLMLIIKRIFHAVK